MNSIFLSSLPQKKSSVAASLDVNSLASIVNISSDKAIDLHLTRALLLKEKLFKCNKTEWTLTLQPKEFAAPFLQDLTDGLQTPGTLRGRNLAFFISTG